MTTVRVGVCQLPVEPGDREGDLVRAEAMVARAAAAGCALVVLPECLDLGGESARTRARPVPGSTTDRLAAAAREHGLMVASGVTELAPDGVVRHAAVLLSSTGELLAGGPDDEGALVVVDLPLRAAGRPAEQPASVLGARCRGDVIELVNEPTEARTVALTFDDGPHPPDTLALLDLLDREGVRAVFCLVGEQAARYPDVVRRIVAAGHRLGAHSWRHDDLEDRDVAEVRDDLERTLAAIRAAVPGVEVPFYRAPFGHWGRTIPVAGELGMRPLGWQTAVWDWDQPGTDELVRRICGVVPGGIVLLHDGGGDRRQTVEAVARVIPRLRADGWTFTVPR